MKNIFPFLNKLAKNNSREWFHANRDKYEEARAEFMVFVSLLLGELKKKDPRLLDLDAKSCVFRINRDVRFSKDKSPYKKNFAASIRAGGKKSQLAGFYVHLEPGDSFIASGVYQPDSESLAKIRQEIDYNFDEFRGILQEKKLKNTFGDLMAEGKTSLPPRGYTKDNPAIDFLKHKHFILIAPIDKQAVAKADFVKKCTHDLSLTNAFNSFLNRALIG